MGDNIDTYLPPMVEPGCGGSILNLAPCAPPADIASSPTALLLGLGVGAVFYLYNRKNPRYRRPALWAGAVGALTAVVYVAIEFVR